MGRERSTVSSLVIPHHEITYLIPETLLNDVPVIRRITGRNSLFALYLLEIMCMLIPSQAIMRILEITPKYKKPLLIKTDSKYSKDCKPCTETANIH